MFVLKLKVALTTVIQLEVSIEGLVEGKREHATPGFQGECLSTAILSVAVLNTIAAPVYASSRSKCCVKN